MRTCVIFNPTAKGEKAKRFRRHLDEIAVSCALKQTTAVGDASRLAAEAVREGFEVVVAAGGDGTLNEVLNGLASVPDGLERARLGLLPLGTVNVFAREMGLPLDLKRSWEAILRGRETRIDLPRAETGNGSDRKTYYFAQMAGAGLDARAVELVHLPLKKRVGPLAYVVAGLKALAGPQAKIRVTGGGVSLTGELVLIGNGRFYGGEYRIFPQADLRDGLLDVCVFPRVNWPVLLRSGPQLLLSGSLPGSVAQHAQAESFELTGEGPTAFEIDGELAGKLPARFSVQRGALRVLSA